MNDVRITPNMTVFQVAALCKAHSTAGVEAYARIEWFDGKAIAYLCRSEVHELIPPAIRRSV